MTALVAYFAPLAALALLIPRSTRLRQTAACVLTISAAILMGHAEFYSDMTFVTAFWVALWLLWWARYSCEAAASSRARLGGRFFGQAVVSLCFFGGFVGKLTPEYWSGEVFMHIYFDKRSYFPFNWLRDRSTIEQGQAIAMWLSRAAICTEGMMACCVLLPTRLAFLCGVMALGGMTVMARTQILSVLGNLGLLLIACLILTERGLEFGRWQIGGTKPSR